MADDLRISIVQSDIIWEDREKNLKHYNSLLKRLRCKTDVAVLPETFTTGFTMHVEQQADQPDGETIQTIKDAAARYDFAIAGSFIVKENNYFYNRAFFVTPEGKAWYYDKKHLFRMAGEHRYFKAGQEQTVFCYKGWNICLQICYDLRFPVWSRNYNKRYDLLINVANWPEARQVAWTTLLRARAIENQVYVCGVNRVGCDGHNIPYQGDSVIFSAKGEKLADAGKRDKAIRTCTLSHAELEAFREKFPVWSDADTFILV